MYNNDTEKLFAEGGMNDEGGTVDPVSGNDVPPGSLQNEVRDDIPAQLSEGEFVIPADVVRYIGLERLMKLRDEAKQGLNRMAEIGQMGNADQVENPEALHEGDEEFDSEIDDIISEVDGEQMGEQKFAAGGYAEPGVDLLSKYNIPRTSLTNPALDVRAYKNKQGRVMYITFFNGKPSIAIPSGYEYISSAGQLLAETKTELTKINAPTIDMGGYGGDGGDGGGSSGDSSAASESDATDGNVANSVTGLAAPANQSIAEVDMGTMSAAAAAEAAAAASMAESAAATASDDASTSEGVSGPGGDGGVSGGGGGGAADSGGTGEGGGDGAAGDGDGGGDGAAGDGDGGGDGGDGGGGDGFAKGGLVAKRPKKPTASSKRGIASRK
jgi:hypothetical protein